MESKSASASAVRRSPQDGSPTLDCLASLVHVGARHWVTGLQSRNRCVNVLEQYSPHGVRILDTSAANDFFRKLSLVRDRVVAGPGSATAREAL
jgi:hypothetical protein